MWGVTETVSLGSQIITPASPETGSFVAPGAIGFLQHNTVIPGNSHLTENILHNENI